MNATLPPLRLTSQVSALIFTLLVVGAGPASFAQTVVNLGTAANYAVLAGTSVTNTGPTVVNGDLGVSGGTAVTGFMGIAPGGLGIVNGSIDAGDAAAIQAGRDLSSAYTSAGAETATVTGVSMFSNTTLTPGVYNAPTTLGISGVITLDGQGLANPVFIFQVGTSLGTAIGSQILLINGATAADIFWQVGSTATLAGTSVFEGNVLAMTSIDLGAGSDVTGSLLAESGAVTLASDEISAVPEPAETALCMGACACLWAGWRTLRSKWRRSVPI